MPVIVVSSPKGGVGKTSLTANLAVALAKQQRIVTAVDFDPQNALRYHFGLDHADGPGVSELLVSGADWASSVLQSAHQVRVLPHGDADLRQILAAEDRVTVEELRFRFQRLMPGPRDIVIADTPPGKNRFLAALEPIADVCLVVFLADAGSMSLLPAYENGLFLKPWKPGDPKTFALLNQVDPRRRLSREINEFAREHLFDRFIGTVHYDEAMAEALANGTTLMSVAVNATGAVQDVLQIADKVASLLVER